MKDTIVYRPWRSYAWFLPFTIPVGMLALVAAGYCLPYSGYGVLVLATIGIGHTWLTKVLYDSSNLAVAFEQKGLRILGGSYKDYRYILWEEVPYAYYVRNYRGNLFLVLSPKALSPDEAKKLAKRGGASKICIDYAVVISIDPSQDTSQIKRQIVHNVLHVDAY